MSGEAPEFKFSTTLDGHASAVKTIDVDFEGALVSGSTDTAVRHWVPDSSGHLRPDGDEVKHDSFVNAVVLYPPSESNQKPTKLFLGTLKGSIVVYQIQDDGGKFVRLCELPKGKAHKANVCTLALDADEHRLLSGSWDHSAAVWSIEHLVDENSQPLFRLEGHEQSVWCIAKRPGHAEHYLTGSADMTIKLWERQNCLRTFTGSEGPVRALLCLSPSILLSVGNDCNVYQWNTDEGVAVQTLPCDRNAAAETYLYCMCVVRALSGVNLLVTGNEAGVLQIMSIHTPEAFAGADFSAVPGDVALDFHRLQTLNVPVNSIWSVKVLPNNDIAAACGDGKIWVFTLNADRVAPTDRLSAYDAHIAAKLTQLDKQNATEPTSTTIQVALDDGQPSMKLVYNHGEDPWAAAERFIAENNLPLMYLDQVGNYIVENVPAARNYTPQTRDAKQTHEGQEYDYVFELGVDDGRQLKLPYNVDQNPDDVARAFIAKHKLEPNFHPMITSFIAQQMASVGHNVFQDPFTGGTRYVPSSGGSSAGGSGGGCDPFTGGGRYIPTGSAGAVNGMDGGGADPFTGSGRYVPSSSGAAAAVTANANQPKDGTRPRGEHVPAASFTQFDHSSVTKKAIDKLKENNELQVGEQRLTDDELSGLQSMMLDRTTSIGPLHLQALEKAVFWPIEQLAPAMDALRLALLDRTAVTHFFNKDGRLNDTLDRLENVLISGAPLPVRVFVCRAVANAIAHPLARDAFIDRMPSFIALITPSLTDTALQMQLAACACLCNFALVLLQRSEQDKVHEVSVREEAVRALIQSLNKVDSFSHLVSPAMLLLMQSVVTILWGDRTLIESAQTLGLAALIAKLKDATPDDSLKAIARDVQVMCDVVAK